MGNQLVAFAPSLIRPVEFYLADLPELSFETNLGSTRFLKVCRAKEGPLLVVVKVFVIHEHTLPIPTYCERLHTLRRCLASTSTPSPNCLPYSRIISTDKSVLVIRPYVKYSLYDRISTRPFLQLSEKLWIAFQLLCGLAQLHKHGLSHGDLKLENILVTPGLRVLLCDFAPFKPVYLPRNNPSAVFGFFFDTAGRRCCYVAPERFRDDKSHLDNLSQEDELQHSLSPSMDIFSAGCCLIELFTEGRVPFDLSQLLLFCADEYDPTPVINLIEDANARELVTHMISRDPAMRSTSQEYLNRFRERLFPEIFYSTLQSYFDILALQPLITPDSRMARLYSDVRTLPQDPALSLIVTSLLNAEIRGLKSVTAKLYALEAFRSLIGKLNDDCVLERVLPYTIYLLQDPVSPRVRAEALTTMVECLDAVSQIPPSDYNIFSAYIFPALERLDRDVAVRIALAKNLSRISQISLRYLEASFLQDPEGYGPHQPQFVAELQSQKDTVATFLSTLLTDNDPVVKRMLVSTPDSLEGLCNYFGKAKAHDILLSHLITFLNDKDDWHLRGAFFRCVPAVASFIGWHAAPILIPLLKQGLSDVEEFVTREALLAIRSLTEIRYFGRRFLLDLLEEVLPFLIHPNLWLRNTSAGILTCIKDNISEVDLHCHVIPRLKMYLKSFTNSIWGLSEVSIFNKVRDPFERLVYESCSKAKGALLAVLIDYLKNSHGIGEPDCNEISNFLLRLKAEGLNVPVDPVYITFLQKLVMKVNAQRCLRTTNQEFTFANANKMHGFTQQQLQSQLLIMSTPPVRELASTGTFSTIRGIEGSSTPALTLTDSPQPGPQFYVNFVEKPRGFLVAHLHEHSSCINKICPLTAFKGLFATACRNDVRIWDAEKMEGRNVANRSRCHIRLPGEKNISNMAYTSGANAIGVADDKTLYGFALENMVAKNIFTFPINNQSVDIGIPMALEAYSPHVMVVGTELGCILGFDSRVGVHEVFRLQSDLKLGLLSSICVDDERHWMCSGTSKGILTCWDMRFSVPVNTIKTDTPVRKLKSSPLHASGVFSCPRYQNETSLWNLETGGRQISLWSSNLPPLSKQPESPVPSKPSMSIFGMTFIKSHNAVVTAGSDMCIRWWDITSPDDSFMLVSPEKPEQPITGPSVKHGDFRFRIVDGVEVIHDLTSSHGPGSAGNKFEAGSNVPSAASVTTPGSSNYYSSSHHNVITDIASVATPNQSFIVSTSADGVIKIWK